MEIKTLVDADSTVDNSQKHYRAFSAFFTYMSLNQEGKSLPVPQLVPETEDARGTLQKAKGNTCRGKRNNRAKQSLSPRCPPPVAGPAAAPASHHLEVVPWPKMQFKLKTVVACRIPLAVLTLLKTCTPKLIYIVPV